MSCSTPSILILTIYRWFVAKCTFFIQPLDRKPFAILSQETADHLATHHHASLLLGDTPTGTVLESIYQSEKKAYSADAIVSSFKECGMEPFKKKKVWKVTASHVHTYTYTHTHSYTTTQPHSHTATQPQTRDTHIHT